MRPSFSFALAAALGLSAAALPAIAADEAGQKIYQAASKSMVAVKYTYNGETQQQDLIVPGLVVGADGLVMISMAAVPIQLPDEQMVKFKIIIPHLDRDNEEIDAEFQGRDQRCSVAFVKAKIAPPTTAPATGPAKEQTPPPVWTPIKFTEEKPAIGDTVYSVGMLPRSGGYHTFLAKSLVASFLRGPVKQVMVSGGSLATAGAPVFNADGQAIGIVNDSSIRELFLDDTVRDPEMAQMASMSQMTVHHTYIPTSEFAAALANPPTPQHPVPMAWSGLPEFVISGLGKNDAALFGLENQPVVQITDILADSPAEKAGLKKKDVIVKVDGEPLERGDIPEEAAMIMHRKLMMKKPGEVVTFTVVDAKGKPPREVKLTMEPEPKQSNAAERYWNEELGFGVREMVLLDRYMLKLKKTEKEGVLVTALKEGSSAGSAGLRPEDMITQVNGQPVNSLGAFKSAYEDFRKAHEHDAIVMVVRRPTGADETVRIEPPQ
jgi:S1-C subfamily serine protease